MEEHVSGFRVRGSWDEVVGHGERITRALRESDVDEELLAEWDDWRPKAHEELGEEVSEKTVEQARIEKGAGEQAGQAPKEDLKRASERALESIEKTEGDGPEDVLDKWEDAIGHGLRAVDTTTRKAIRTFETVVYEQVMTRFTPFYFDNELISANIRETAGLKNGTEFIFEVNVNDDHLKQEVSQRLSTAGNTERENS